MMTVQDRREALGAFVLPRGDKMSGTDYKNETDWLAARQNGIGASEAAAILGYSRFASPWSVWARKTGKVPAMRGAPSEMAEWGHRLEEPVAVKFTEVTGRKVTDPGDYWIERNGILSCTPDRFQVTAYSPADKMGPRGVLELKCAWFHAWQEWERQVPRAYQIQLQQAMHCCGCDYGSFAVLGNGCKFKLFHVKPHPKFSAIVERLEWWWDQYVIGDRPPPTDPSEATSKALTEMYPEVKVERVDLEGEELTAAHELRTKACAAIAVNEDLKNGATNVIKAAMGTAEFGVLPDDSGYSWRQGKKFRIFRRIEKCPQPK